MQLCCCQCQSCEVEGLGFFNSIYVFCLSVLYCCYRDRIPTRLTRFQADTVANIASGGLSSLLFVHQFQSGLLKHKLLLLPFQKQRCRLLNWFMNCLVSQKSHRILYLKLFTSESWFVLLTHADVKIFLSDYQYDMTLFTIHLRHFHFRSFTPWDWQGEKWINLIRSTLCILKTVWPSQNHL